VRGIFSDLYHIQHLLVAAQYTQDAAALLTVYKLSTNHGMSAVRNSGLLPTRSNQGLEHCHGVMPAVKQ
jgi:hypothetical protein